MCFLFLTSPFRVSIIASVFTFVFIAACKQPMAESSLRSQGDASSQSAGSADDDEFVPDEEEPKLNAEASVKSDAETEGQEASQASDTRKQGETSSDKKKTDESPSLTSTSHRGSKCSTMPSGSGADKRAWCTTMKPKEMAHCISDSEWLRECGSFEQKQQTGNNPGGASEPQAQAPASKAAPPRCGDAPSLDNRQAWCDWHWKHTHCVSTHHWKLKCSNSTTEFANEPIEEAAACEARGGEMKHTASSSYCTK